MFIARRLLILTSRILLAALLFVQFAHAAEPCFMPEMRAAMAFDDGGAHCQGNPNACLSDCMDDSQSASHTEIPVLAASLTAVLTMPTLAVASAVTLGGESCYSFSSDPPIPIRFCSFRN